MKGGVASPSLERAIGPFPATLLVIGGVIGSGIFLTTGSIAAALPSPLLILAVWIAGCVFALAGALTYAELGSMFPRAGGVYLFLHEAFGPLIGFLYGWTSVLVVLAGGIAAVAMGFAETFSYFVPALSSSQRIVEISMFGGTWTLAAHQLVAVASIVALAVVNYFGVRAGTGTNSVLTIAKVGGLVLLPVFAIVGVTQIPAWTPVVPAEIAAPIAAFGVGLIPVLWACEGYYFLTYAGGEVRDPARTIPRALTAGLLTIMAIYVVANVVYVYALPVEQLRGTTRVAEAAARAMVGDWGATMIAATVVVSTLGANAAVILTGSRVIYAMASQGLFFRAGAAVHSRYRSPHVAIVGLAAWASVLALSGTFEQLFTYVVFTSVLFNMLGGLAVFRLRRTRPDHPRPYRVWGYPIVPAVFVLASLYLVVNTLAARPWQSIAGLSLLVLGLPVYMYWSRARLAAANG
jgi:APA family basic amino acid/polyamine antiporter